jgi:hypothetical protein
MFTFKSACLAAAVFAASAAGSMVTAYAAVEPTDSPITLQTSAGQPQTTANKPVIHFVDPSVAPVGADGLLMNGLLPVPPTYG